MQVWVCSTLFSERRGHILILAQTLTLKFLIIRFLMYVVYCIAVENELTGQAIE